MSFSNSVSKVALTSLLLLAAQPVLAQSDDSDEVVVTGALILEDSVDDAIAGVSVLEAEELDDRLAATIGETLKYEPGVSSTFFGPGASRPIIRGQGGDRVRVLTNGIGSIDASSASPDHAVAAEPAQAEQIEVLRGASILRFGSSGAGGIVNVIDGRIPQEVPEDGTDVALRMSVSSVDMGAELAGSIDQALGESIVVHLDGTWRETEDYDIPGFAESAIFRAAEEAEEEEEGHDEEEEEEEEAFGTLENSFTESASVTGGLSYVGERGFFGVSIHRFESLYGVPGGHGHEEEEEEEEDHDEEEEEEEEESVSIDLEQTRFDLNGALELDGFIDRVQVFAGYADYEHIENEGDEIGTVFANEGWEARLEAIQAEKDGWKAAYGVQVRNRDFSAIGEEAFVPPTVTEQYGIYTFQQFDLGSISLEGAARYEMTDQDNSTANVSESFNLFNVSGGVDFNLADGTKLGASGFRTERAPTSEELYSNGPHLATGQFEIGDPDLGKEAALGGEVSFRHRGETTFLTANAFYTVYDDYIFERATGEEEDELDVFEFIAEDADYYGFEVQGAYDFGVFSLDGLVEFIRAETDSDNLPRIPPLSVLVGGDIELNEFKLRGEVEYADSQNNIAAEELPTDSYTLANAFLTWDPSTKHDVKFKISVLNLFDDDARQHSSFLKDLVPLPGRNVRFSVATKF